jgi:hypothetical protein
MALKESERIVQKLLDFQRQVRAEIVSSRKSTGLYEVRRSSSADTIYGIDAEVDPILEAFCEDWSRTTPLVLIAEGLENDDGGEGKKVFPHGTAEDDAEIRLIVDPIDGTRGIMYDKRPAWALAGVAPNKGPGTSLRDIEVAVMTELPTSKMAFGDVLWAIKGQGAHGRREQLSSGASESLVLKPSQADDIRHGFAMISNFFPGTKMLSSELMEHLARKLIGPADVTKAMIFEDQYICTGGQFYELIVGHDRFNADLRSLFYRIQQQPEGLCVHPYDVAGLLIAEEAGVSITNGLGQPLDGPLDVTTGLSWAGYANKTLQEHIEPLLTRFLQDRLPL